MTDDVMTQLAAARTNPSIIMVVGVGGAGGNAVNHMWNLGIKGVDFMVCNTDQQALDKSPVELKVRLGSEGVGAGDVHQVALDRNDLGDALRSRSQDVIGLAESLLQGQTAVYFKNILVVDNQQRIDVLTQLLDAPERLFVTDLAFDGQRRSDDADGQHSHLLGQLGDHRRSARTRTVSKVMRDSGRAHMSVATAEGDNRAEAVAEASLHSPLLDHNLISGARNILLNISVANAEELMYEEVVRILEYIQAHASVEDESGNIHNANIIWGTSEKPQLGNAIELVVVATGFEGDEEKRMMKTVIPPARIVKPVPEGGDPAGKPVLEPVGKPGKATPQTRPLEQVILGEKSTRYSNIDQILAKPAYQSRKAQFIVEMPAGRKEVLKEEKGAAERAEENRSESLFD